MLLIPLHYILNEFTFYIFPDVGFGEKIRETTIPLDSGPSGACRAAWIITTPSQNLVSKSKNEMEKTGKLKKML